MRILLVLLMTVGFISFVSGQDEKQKEVPIRHYFPIVYKNSNNLKVILNEAATKLKSVPDSKIYIVYYAGLRQNKIKFNRFKLRVQKTLVESNKIKTERISIIDGGNSVNDYVSFQIWIIDKSGNRIYPS